MFKINDLIMPLYECPMCRKSFDKFDDANICIGNHITPVTIKEFDDMEDHGPTTIIVNMSNGNQYEYRLYSTNGNSDAT